MTRSLLKNRGREGLSYGAFLLSWQNTNHLQRILDGGLALEITSWNALVHHCSFSCGFSKQIHPHSCVTRANQQRREVKMQWLPKRAALQGSSHPAQHRQQLGSQGVCQYTGVFQQRNFHWHVNIDRLLPHHEGDSINRVLPKKALSEGWVVLFPPCIAHLGQNQTEPLAGGRGEGRWREGVSSGCSSCAHSTYVSLILYYIRHQG